MSDSPASQSDPQLLRQFAETRCERVFEVLVERYGPLVMAICLRTLQNQHDAEDVFQATFLVLAEKAGKIKKRESLPSWLSGVAHRLSMNLARKRHRKDLALNAEPEAARDHFVDLQERFEAQAMDEELHALPPKYRDALVRFYFLGQTSRQIAESLGITQGAADGRIRRGRQELRVRLAKRGVALGSAMAVVALSAQSVSAAIAPTLVQSTVQVAVAKGAVGLCSQTTLDLAGTELMKTTSMLSSVVAVCSTVALLGIGAFGLNAGFARSAAAAGDVITTETEVAPEAPYGDGSVEAGVTLIRADEKMQSAKAGDRYEFRESDLTELTETLRQKFPQAVFQSAGPNKLLAFGAQEDLKKIRQTIGEVERDAFKDRFSTTIQHLYIVNKDRAGDVIPEVRDAVPDARINRLPPNRFLVKGTDDVLKAARNVILDIDPDARMTTHLLVPADQRNRPRVRPGEPALPREPAGRVAANRPPTFVRAKLSQDGESIAVSQGARTVTQTYQVLVPVTVQRPDENGRIPRVQTARAETRTRTVPVGRDAKPTLYKTSAIGLSLVSGEKVDPENVARYLKGNPYVVVLHERETISDLYSEVLRPSLLVLTLPSPRKAVPPVKQFIR